jgi:Chain length determinant protein
MDLISIVQIVWRHKFVTIPVILFTCLLAFYFAILKAPVYQASESFALVYPPGPPTAAEIAANPKLGKVNTANPLLAYSDPSAVTQIVISLASTSSSAQALAKAGAGTQWQITPSAGSSEILDVSGVGPTAQAALLSANLVTKAAEHALYQVQANQGVNPTYMIKSYQLDIPNQAAQKLSSKLRPLVAVLGLGLILLFIAISIAEAITRRHNEPSGNHKVPSRLAIRGEPLDQTERIRSPLPYTTSSRRGAN